MAARKVYFISPHGKKGWKVMGENAKRALRILDTKKEALGWVTTMAKKHRPSQVKIKRADGTYEKEYLYD